MVFESRICEHALKALRAIVTVDHPQKVAADRAQVRYLTRNDRRASIGGEVPPPDSVVSAPRGPKDGVEPRPVDAGDEWRIGAQRSVEQLSNGDEVHRHSEFVTR